VKRFTTDDIRYWKPHFDPSDYLAETWQGTVLDILNNKRIPFKDRLWVIMRKDLVSEKLMRRFAVWCARQVQHLMRDERSLYALDVAEAYAENRWLLDDEEHVKAWESKRAAAWVAALDAAEAAALDAADAAARHAAEAATQAVAGDASQAATDTATWAVADFVEWIAAQVAQERKLREMLIEGIETGDTKC
jgi:hypothetical protein